jgi:hypothetical protein
MSTERVNPAADLEDRGDVSPRPVGQRRTVSRDAINDLAHRENFPSRTPASAPVVAGAALRSPAAPVTSQEPVRRVRRQYVTGRNQQFNIKATAETVDRFYAVANEVGVPLGELLRLTLEAFERERARQA